MNRNVESRFALAPSVDVGRSRFKRPSKLSTSWNVGDLVPIFVEPIIPGETVKMKTSKVIRLSTPITPFFDNLYCDFFWFFVPMRLVWEHTKEYFRENTASAWYPQVTYTKPQIEPPAGGWISGTIADYMRQPIGVDGYQVDALPFRAYALICNEFFRSTALTDPLNIPVNDTTQTGSNGTSYINDVANGGMPFKVSKYHDYFTSCLVSPQYGEDVVMDVVGGSGLAPVGFIDPSDGLTVSDIKKLFGETSGNAAWYGSMINNASGTPAVSGQSGYLNVLGTDTSGYLRQHDTNTTISYSGEAPIFNNLFANLGGATGIGFTVNAMRTAFQLQKFYERQARSGSRYIETIKAMFGVSNPDYRLQRPEYLGGSRLPLAVSQVVQTSQTATTPQGTVAGNSVTSDVHDDFVKSFTEHGYLIGLMAARYDHTYADGIERWWFNKDFYDEVWPLFAHLGEQPVYNKEIFVQGASVVDSDGNIVDDQVFGYQEQYAYMRYKPSAVTGLMRPKATGSLAVWNFADDYNSLPYLSDAWIREDLANVDRTLQVTSQVSNQLIGDFYFDMTTVLPLPMFSVPGLVDHF